MVQAPIEPQLFYPDSDGKPMADNTVQYRWIVRLVANLKYLFKGQTVFVAGDLLWYPQQVTVPPAPRQAPDAMVVFGICMLKMKFRHNSGSWVFISIFGGTILALFQIC